MIPIMANYRSHGFDALLVKPYKITDLYNVMQGVLLGDPI